MSPSKEGFLWSRGKTQHGLESAAVVPQSNRFQETYDVVVLGAGFAGLTAARDLSKSHRVLLLDARDRIGGRTWTANALGQEIEMGGTWVHW
jgi:monoamine oxidase